MAADLSGLVGTHTAGESGADPVAGLGIIKSGSMLRDSVKRVAPVVESRKQVWCRICQEEEKSL